MKWKVFRLSAFFLFSKHRSKKFVSLELQFKKKSQSLHLNCDERVDEWCLVVAPRSYCGIHRQASLEHLTCVGGIFIVVMQKLRDSKRWLEKISDILLFKVQNFKGSVFTFHQSSLCLVRLKLLVVKSFTWKAFNYQNINFIHTCEHHSQSNPFKQPMRC